MNKKREDLKQRIAKLEQLLSISRRLNSTLQMRPLLQQIVHSARELTDADEASILLMRSDHTLHFAAASGPQASVLIDSTEVPLDGSLAGWVVKNRELLIVEDAQSDPRHYAIQSIDPTQSIVAVPMLFGEQVVGVVEAITTKTRHRFTDHDLETIETLASIAAVAVENARLFEQSDWVAEVVHEIRTPLTAILSYAELLTRPGIDEAMRERFAEIILQETERINQLATDFLDLARLESGRIQMEQETLDMATIVSLSASVIRPRAEQQERTLKVETPDDLPKTVGDTQRIHQVVLNLLSNAVKYSDPGDQITLKVWQEEDRLIAAVEDTGPGIPDDQIPHLFQKFARLPGSERKAQGTGLGLVVARQIVEAHNGQIWVESEVGQGSTFYFSLPIIAPQPEAEVDFNTPK